ncbi:MAG: protein kinase [Blastocatellia bacterium]|nr:protein kinase [Blastocatellia bacterium]
MRPFLSFLLLGMLLSLFPAPAAALPSRFAHYSVEQGLSQMNVHCLVQDGDGYLWVGTQDGLNRFDGYTFTVYRNDLKNENSLSGNYIRALCEDPAGWLWVGTDNGLDQMDRTTGQCRHYRFDPNDPGSLTGNKIRALQVDSLGSLWVGTSTGLNRLDPKSGRCTRFVHSGDGSASIGGNWVSSLCEDPAGFLWVGTFNGGLSRFDLLRGGWTQFAANPNDPDTLGSNIVTSLWRDHHGLMWIGTLGGGLHHLDPVSMKITRMAGDSRSPNGLGNERVYAVREDSKGILWVGTDGGGLVRWDRQHDLVSTFTKNPHDPLGIHSDSVVSLYEDRSGVFWVGTLGAGLQGLDQAAARFQRYQNDSDDPTGLSSNRISAFCEGEPGVLWVGTDGGGLNCMDLNTGRCTIYRNHPKDVASPGGDSVAALCRDGTGTIWVGLFGGGLSRMDPQTGRFARFRHDPNQSESLGADSVRALCPESDGTLWVGLFGNGLDRFDPSTGRFRHYRHIGENPKSLSHDKVTALYRDREGRLWIGTSEGVSRYEPETDSFTVFRHEPGKPTGLSNGNVTALCQDETGALWVGTNEGGLNRLDPATGQWRLFTMEQGLPSNTIMGLLTDEFGHLWMSTDRGLCKFDLGTMVCRNYDVRDGLQGNEFTPGAAYRSRSGELFFGGVSGFNRFHPKWVVDNPYTPPVVITSFRIFDQPVTGFNGVSIAPLTYRQNFFAVEFAAFNFTLPEKNLYAYKLEGLDDQWVYCGTRRFVSYTNLDPGSYILRVKGSNNDGIWNQAGTSLKIEILPPPWRTKWAYALYCLLVVGGLWGGFRLQQNRYETEAALMEAHWRAEAAEANEKREQMRAQVSEEERKAAEAKAEAAEIEARAASRLALQNAELDRTNRELAEKNEALVLSQQQADRIFSALAQALPGTILDGKYRLEEKIGTGGFGVVFRGTHLVLNRSIAVKVFRPTPGNDSAEAVERFKQEGISAARLNHPNAVSILDSGISTEGIVYLIMELLQGRTLADELKGGRVLSLLRCLEILMPVCEVLAEAHRQGIVHRDIKPENIFLRQTDEGEIVKVVDFGIAKLLGQDSLEQVQKLTMTGTVVGTPLYMAPERLNGDPYDGRADVYSVGVMLYEMLAGRPPFRIQNGDVLSLLLAHLNDTPPPLRSFNPNLSCLVEAVVLQTLVKAPETRPTAAQLAEQFANAVAAINLDFAPQPAGDGGLVQPLAGGEGFDSFNLNLPKASYSEAPTLRSEEVAGQTEGRNDPLE